MTKAEYKGLVEVAEEIKRRFAKEFAYWIGLHYFSPITKEFWHIEGSSNGHYKTLDELLQLFEEETK